MYDRRPVSPDRTLVIPMHQESARIGPTLRELAAARDVLGHCDLVLVDDGSSDGTADAARRALDETGLPGRVIRLERNSGKGAAIAAGVACATGRVVAFTDADLAAGVEALDQCCSLVESGEADVVVTSRRLPDSEITTQAPVARRSTSAVFRQVVRWAGLRGVSDSQCGVKAFRGEVARTLFSELSVQRFAFDVEVLLRAELAGFNVVEVPVRWRHVDASSLRTVRDGTRMLVDVVRLRSRVRGWEPDDKKPVAALLEREHWWWVANRRFALAAASRAAASGPHLDADHQTGALLDAISHDLGGAAFGVTASAWDAGDARHPTVVASPLELALRDGSVGSVFVVDRLEYFTEDEPALREAARVLRPDGVLVLTVPANPSLWTEYDVVLGHQRRYSPASIRAVLEREGFEVIDVAYFFAWLTPITLVLARTPLRSLLLRDAERSSFVHRRINTILRLVVAAEVAIAERVHLPFGQALVVSARKR